MEPHEQAGERLMEAATDAARAEEDSRAAFDLITDPMVRDAVCRFVDASRDVGDAMTKFVTASCKQVSVTLNDGAAPDSTMIVH